MGKDQAAWLLLAAALVAGAGLGALAVALGRRKQHPDYWQIYSDVLVDLGGIDGGDSADAERPRYSD